MSRSMIRLSALLTALVLLLPAAVGGPPGRPPAAAALSGGPPATAALSSGPFATAALPAGFTDQTVLAGLTRPTKLAFSPDGRIFVAEKAGLVKVFDGPGDPTPVVFADLRPQVHVQAVIEIPFQRRTGRPTLPPQFRTGAAAQRPQPAGTAIGGKRVGPVVVLSGRP